MNTNNRAIIKIPLNELNKTDNICLNIYNLFDTLLKQVDSNLLDFKGGMRSNNKKIIKKQFKDKTNKISRNRKNKSKKVKKMVGGSKYIVIFFATMLLLALQVNGVRNMTKQEVINRLISTSGKVSNIFNNLVGTCSLNMMLWLKAIDLPTFETKSVEMLKTTPGMKTIAMSSLLNKNLNFGIHWTNLSLDKHIFDLSEREIIGEYINMIKLHLIMIRKKIYGENMGYHIITAGGYPFKNNTTSSHTVVFWLIPNDETNSDSLDDNDIAIIDPQTFAGKKVPIIYSSGITSVDRNVRKHALTGYVKDNIDYKNSTRQTSIFDKLHLEIEDKDGSNRFSIDNNKIFETINVIKQTLAITHPEL